MNRENNEQKYISIIGKGIKKLREDSNKSLRLFANEAGISPATLSRIERGERIPSILTLKKLSAVLNISVSDYIQKIENLFTDEIKGIEI